MQLIMKNENIIIIGPNDYGICDEIIKKLKKNIKNVYFIDEVPSLGLVFFNRILYRLPSIFFNNLLKLYFKKKLNLVNQNKIHKVLIIRGRYLSKDLLEYIFNKIEVDKKTMYQWDSSKNLPLLEQQIDLFDNVYTFDKNDAINFKLKYQPLFIRESVINTKLEKSVDYDISFICSLHSDRGSLVKNLLNLNKSLFKVNFVSLYMPFLTFIYRKATGSKVTNNLSIKDISFQQVDISKCLNIFNKSKVILDINQPNQTGLSLRVFEAIGLQKKLITTNKEIKNHNFYNKNNFYVLDRSDLRIDSQFPELDFVKLDDHIYDEYTLESWIKKVL